MSNFEWRWADPTGQQRLVRTDELRAALSSGLIPANAPVWRKGWPEWKPAHDVPELTTSALAAANGVLLNVPPPPLFVVAAQSEFEAGPDSAAEEEPPLPPRYVPMEAPKPPTIPPVVDVKKEEKKPKEPPKIPPAPVAAQPKPKDPLKIPPAPTKAAASPKAPPVAAKPASPAKPPPPAAGATRNAGIPPGPPPGSEMRSIPTMRGIPIIPDPTKVPKFDLPKIDAAAAPPKVAPVAADAPSAKARATLPVFPAPPPMAKEDEPPSRAPELTPTVADAPAVSKNPTLIQFGGAPESSPPPAATAPIVVPPPEPSEVTGGSVTRPPPWGEGAVDMAPDIPKPMSPPKIAPENVEELSGSMLIDSIPPPLPGNRPVELSSSDLTSEHDLVVAKPPPLAPAEKRTGTLLGMAPPPIAKDVTEPLPLVTKTESKRPPPPSPSPAPPKPEGELRTSRRPSDDLDDDVPPPRPSGARTIDLRQLARDRPPWFMAVAGGVGTLLALGLVGVGMKIAGAGHDTPNTVPSSSVATTSASTTATASTSATAPVTSASAIAATPKPVTCRVVGKPKTVATRAMVASGVEVRTVGDAIALGFATGPRDGTVLSVDPSSLDTKATTHTKGADTIRRVVALKGGPAADVDRKGDKLQGRRSVAVEPPIDLGSDGSNVAWAPHGTDKTIALWPLGGTGPVEALRAERTDAGTFVAFRQGSSIYVGTFGGTPPAPLGLLSRIDGLGTKVGSPALAVDGPHALVVFADRANDADPWGLRWVSVTAGKEPSAAKTFSPPAGGLGEHAMSPGVARVGDGAFLLVWTEGPTSNHQVRGLVVDAAGEPHGTALMLSADGENAGQGQAAITSTGQGVVAFLAAGAPKSFDVLATSITCTSP